MSGLLAALEGRGPEAEGSESVLWLARAWERPSLPESAIAGIVSRLALRDVLTCRLVSKVWSAAAAGTVRHLDLSLKQPYGSSTAHACRTSHRAGRRAGADGSCITDTQQGSLQPAAQAPGDAVDSESPGLHAGSVPGPLVSLAGACAEHVGERRSAAAVDRAQQDERDVRQQLQELLSYLYDTWPGVDSLTLSCCAAGRALHPELSLALLAGLLSSWRGLRDLRIKDMPLVPCRTVPPSCRTSIRQYRRRGQPPWQMGPASGPAAPRDPGVTSAAAGAGPTAEARGDAWDLSCLACLPHLTSLEVDMVPAVQAPAGGTHAADDANDSRAARQRGRQSVQQQRRWREQRQQQQQRQKQLGLALGQARMLKGLSRLTALRSLSLSLLDLPPAVLAEAAAANAAAANAAAAAAPVPRANGAAAAAAAPPRPAVRRRFEGVGRPGAGRGGGSDGQDRDSSGGMREARGDLGRTLGALGWVHAGEATAGTAGGGVETTQTAKPSNGRDSDGRRHEVSCTALGYDSDGAIEYGSDLDLGTEEAEEPEHAEQGGERGDRHREGQEVGMEGQDGVGVQRPNGVSIETARPAFEQPGASGEGEAAGGSAAESEEVECGPGGRRGGFAEADAGLKHGHSLSSTCVTLAESATAASPLGAVLLAEDEDSSVSSYNGDEEEGGGQGEECRDGGDVGSGAEGGIKGGPLAAADEDRGGGHDSDSGSGGGNDADQAAASLRVWTPQPAVFAQMVHLQVLRLSGVVLLGGGGLAALAAAVPGLRSLSLQGKLALGHSDMRSVGRLTRLQDLSLSRCSLMYDAADPDDCPVAIMEELYGSLRRLPCFESLRFDLDSAGGCGIHSAYLLDLYDNPLERLRALNLSTVVLDSDYSFHLLAELTSLTSLTLSYTTWPLALESADMTLLAPLTGLRRFSMTCVPSERHHLIGLSGRVTEELSRAWTRLTSLQFAGQILTDRPMGPSLTTLAAWTSLRDLALTAAPDDDANTAAHNAAAAAASRNRIATYHASGSCKAAGGRSSEQQLQLQPWVSPLCLRGGLEVDVASCVPPSLTRLSLSGLRLGAAGLMQLGDTLTALTSLQVLDCGLTAEHIMAAATVAKRLQLQVLVLSDSVPWGAAEGLPHAPQLQQAAASAPAGVGHPYSADAGGEASSSASLSPAASMDGLVTEATRKCGAGYAGAAAAAAGRGVCAYRRVAPHPLEGPGTWPRPRQVAADARTSTDGHDRASSSSRRSAAGMIGTTAGVDNSSVTPPVVTNPEAPHLGVLGRHSAAIPSCSVSASTPSSYPTCPTCTARATCPTDVCVPRRMLRTALTTLGSVRSLEYLLLGLPDTPPLCISDLAPLSALTGLRCLTLQARGLATEAPADVRALLMGLTRLRSVHVSGPMGAAAGGEAGTGDEGQGGSGGSGGRGKGRGADGWAVEEGVLGAARELPYVSAVR